jgi:uncharacterized protein (DUF433 family)
MAPPVSIEINPRVMLGKPVIRGTRIPVELILRKLSEGASEADLLDGYPSLKREDIQAAMRYAADTLAHEEVVFIGRVRRASRLAGAVPCHESCDFTVVTALRNAGHDITAIAEINPELRTMSSWHWPVPSYESC